MTLHPGLCGCPSLASYLWWPFKIIVRDPKETAIVFLLITLTFSILGKLSSITANYITWYGVFGLLLFCIWYLILFAARSLAFPGHLSIVKRQLENEVTKRSSKYHKDSIETARRLLVLKETDDTIHFVNQLKIISHHIENNLSVTRNVLLRVKEKKYLSSAAGVYLSALDDYLNDYNNYIKSDIDKVLSPRSSVSTTSKARLISCIESKRSSMTRQLQTLSELSSSLHYIEMPTKEIKDVENIGIGGDEVDVDVAGADGKKKHWLVSIVKSIKDFFDSWRAARAPLDTVINMAYLRHELFERYNAVEGWVGNDRVDSIYFPHREETKKENVEEEVVEEEKKSGKKLLSSPPSKIVIMCFPNAGILEFVHYQSDWLPFYLNHGYAVVMFNYRGYGFNQFDSPSPSAIKEDSNIILEKLVSMHPDAKIMVHGESMGGMVACSLASRYPLHISLAYVDRTFCNLPRVGSTLLKMDFVNSFGPYILPWKTDNVKAWLAIECPKVCANDPHDTMIDERSSLKEGVAEEVMKQAIDNNVTWATDRRRLMPLWLNKSDEDDEEGNNGEGGISPGNVLTGTFNALKTLLEAGAVRDRTLISRVLSSVFNLDGRQNKTLGEAMNDSKKDSLESWSKTLLVWGPSTLQPDLNVVKAERVASMKMRLQKRGLGDDQAASVAEQRVNSVMPVDIDKCYHIVQEAIVKDAGGPQGKLALEGKSCVSYF